MHVVKSELKLNVTNILVRGPNTKYNIIHKPNKPVSRNAEADTTNATGSLRKVQTRARNVTHLREVQHTKTYTITDCIFKSEFTIITCTKFILPSYLLI
jgi:hypothetical protein